MKDPKPGLDFTHMELIMKTLARFHAFGHHLLNLGNETELSERINLIQEGAMNGAFLTKDETVSSQIGKLYKGLIRSAISALKEELGREEQLM